MEWLNYHHLLYFWTVAKEGSIARACDKLLLAQPTISGQIRLLEKALGEKLFTKAGRRLVLTETGQIVYRYADEMFTLGREMVDTIHGRPTGRPLELVVGIADVLPKLVSFRLLHPALRGPLSIRLVCREDKPDRLIAELAVHQLDLVLSDAPMNPGLQVRAYNHLLGECGVTIMGTTTMARKFRRNFPRSLEAAPWLLPTSNTTLRRSLDQWFDLHDIRPNVQSEFEDSALLKVFGQEGLGVFAVPSIVETEVSRQYSVRPIGRLEEVKERFYAISAERKLKHPAILAICNAARETLAGV